MNSVTQLGEFSFQGICDDMAERLGLGPEVRELKLGPTFTSNKSMAFHTLKYDFKPASVDVSKMAKVDVGTNNTMTVTVPHLDGAGIPHTVFKGSQRPYSKECVLIIDRITGEITLEKLSSNIQVKKTRVEPKCQSLLTVPTSNSSNRPNTPVEMRRSPTHGRSTSRTKVASGKKREPTVQLPSKLPQQHSPLTVSPYHAKSPSSLMSNRSPSTGASTLASLPMIGGDFDDYVAAAPAAGPPPAPVASHHSTAAPSNTSRTSAAPGVSSERTHSSKLPSSGSGGGPPPRDSAPEGLGTHSESSSSSSSSDSSDSDSDAENIPVPMSTPITNGHANGAASSPLLNMPDNLLNDDLQLSESESDRD